MKCAEYKELALKRIKIWNDAKVRLEQTFDEWEGLDTELAESVDVAWANRHGQVEFGVLEGFYAAANRLMRRGLLIHSSVEIGRAHV